MRRFLLAWCLLLAGIVCIAQSEHVSAFWQSRDSNYNIAISGGGGSYTGPVDVVASPFAFWGGQAMTAAYATAAGKGMNVCLASDVACGDLSFGSNGNLTDSLIGGSDCAIVTCTIHTYYDQTAGGNCSGSCDMINTSEVNRDKLVFSGGRAFGVCSNAGCGYTPASNSSLSQAFTISSVFQNTASAQSTLWSCNPIQIGYSQTAANQAYSYTNGSASMLATASDGALHAIQWILNTSSSILYVDGSSTSGSVGALNCSGSQMSLLYFVGNGQVTNQGQFGQLGIWTSAFSSGQQSAMNSNEHTNWGF